MFHLKKKKKHFASSYVVWLQKMELQKMEQESYGKVLVYDK